MKGLKLGNRRCECSVCNECFNSVSAFDKHRVRGTCLSTEQMREKGMVENNAGYWVASINPMFEAK